MYLKTVFIILLWLLAVGLVAWLLLDRQQGDANIRLELQNVQPEQPAELPANAAQVSTSTLLVAPRFTGRDMQGQTWDIEADTASRSGNLEDDLITLERVTALLHTPAGDPLTFEAHTGEFSNNKSLLNLAGAVIVRGYDTELKAPALKTNLLTRNMTAGPQVEITSQWEGWQVELSGRTLAGKSPGPVFKLTGNVRGRFWPIKVEEK
jgi:lipopolysaccharide export system protein LptC